MGEHLEALRAEQKRFKEFRGRILDILYDYGEHLIHLISAEEGRIEEELETQAQNEQERLAQLHEEKKIENKLEKDVDTIVDIIKGV